MSKISKSVRHLIRGRFLSHKKDVKQSDTKMCLELAKSGFITRNNLFNNFIAGVHDLPSICNNHKLSTASCESIKRQFEFLLAQKNFANLTDGNWKEVKSSFTFLRIPKSISDEKVEILVTAHETESNISSETDNVETKYNISIQSSEISKSTVTPCIFYTILPLHSEKGKWTFAYQDLLRSRRKWWKRYFFNPSSIEVTDTDARTEAPKASIKATFEGQNFDLSNNLTLENIRMLDKHEIPELDIQYNDEIKKETLAENFKIIETSCYLSSGCVALMLDSVRKRLFLDSTRIALDQTLAPFKVSTYCAEPSGQCSSDHERHEMKLLKSYLRQLLEKENIILYDYFLEQEDGNTYSKFSSLEEAGDAHGVPHQIIITPESLKNGIVLIRDREVRIIYHTLLTDLGLFRGQYYPCFLCIYV